MKTLALIRHGKSSWDDPALADIDRPLNPRGMRNAPDMGRRLAERGQKPDLFLTSPARRARDTAGIIAREVDYPESALHIINELYLADTGTLLRVVQELDDACDEAWIVGHNPDLTDFANGLGDFQTNNMPTGAVCRFAFDVSRWGELMPGMGTLREYDTPKHPWKPG